MGQVEKLRRRLKAVRGVFGRKAAMPRAQQTITNDKDGPIYISVEPWPDCYELEPGDRLTFLYALPDSGDALDISFLNERELVIWPNGDLDALEVLFNGEPAEERSWKFKHE